MLRQIHHLCIRYYLPSLLFHIIPFIIIKMLSVIFVKFIVFLESLSNQKL